MTNNEELSEAQISEYTVLAKFDGDPTLENLTERIHIEDGEIIKVEKYENGELVSSETVGEVE